MTSGTWTADHGISIQQQQAVDKKERCHQHGCSEIFLSEHPGDYPNRRVFYRHSRAQLMLPVITQ